MCEYKPQYGWLTWRRVAYGERVTDITTEAETVGGMHNDAAFSVDTARAGARILTLLVDTGLLQDTVTIANTLWPTVGGSADISCEATARGRSSS